MQKSTHRVDLTQDDQRAHHAVMMNVPSEAVLKGFVERFACVTQTALPMTHGVSQGEARGVVPFLAMIQMIAKRG